MTNCSRPDCGAVSGIHLKIGTDVDHPGGQRSRSEGHVTYSIKNYNNSVLDGPMKITLGAT